MGTNYCGHVNGGCNVRMRSCGIKRRKQSLESWLVRLTQYVRVLVWDFAVRRGNNSGLIYRRQLEGERQRPGGMNYCVDFRSGRGREREKFLSLLPPPSLSFSPSSTHCHGRPVASCGRDGQRQKRRRKEEGARRRGDSSRSATWTRGRNPT